MHCRDGWTVGLASILPALLLAHAGCAGRSESHGEAAGGGAGEPTGGTGGSATGGTLSPGGRGSTVNPGGSGRSTGVGGTLSPGNGGTGGTLSPGSAGRSGGTGGIVFSPEGPVLDFSTIECADSLDNKNTPEGAAADFMTSSCAKQFCHGKNFVASLDLRPDEGFAQRLLDAPALHEGIPCPDDITAECIPASCPPPGSVKLIDSTDPMASWILTTTHNEQGDCSERMPDGTGLDPESDACLTTIVNATAALK